MRVITTTISERVTPPTEQAQNRVSSAADLLYAAECAFHDAHQSNVDAWIKAAGVKLHNAVATHLAAVAASTGSPSTNVNL